jgi:rhamnose transport system ATP-binding protein
MPDGRPLLSVREVSKSFGAVAAVRDVSFDLYGVPIDLGGPVDAKAAGIAVIYQEPTLFPDLSVAENIAMGRQPLGRFKTIDRAAMVRQTAQLFVRPGVSIDPNRPEFTAATIDQFNF